MDGSSERAGRRNPHRCSYILGRTHTNYSERKAGADAMHKMWKNTQDNVMISEFELITLHSEHGAKTYTRGELEHLMDAGVLPSSLGAEDPEVLKKRENEEIYYDFLCEDESRSASN